MTKYLLNTTLLFLIGLTLFSCDSKNETNYGIEGFWRVATRSFDSNEDDLKKRVNDYLLPDYLSKLGQGEYIQFKDGKYEEGFIDVISGSGENAIIDYVPRLSGSYSYDKNNETIKVTVTNSRVGIWTYDVKVSDINSEFVNLEQNMNNKDLSVFMNTFFDSPSTYDESITAKWISTCIKSDKK